MFRCLLKFLYLAEDTCEVLGDRLIRHPTTGPAPTLRFRVGCARFKFLSVEEGFPPYRKAYILTQPRVEPDATGALPGVWRARSSINGG